MKLYQTKQIEKQTNLALIPVRLDLFICNKQHIRGEKMVVMGSMESKMCPQSQIIHVVFNDEEDPYMGLSIEEVYMGNWLVFSKSK